MKIVVCVKSVPDTTSERSFTPEFAVDRRASTSRLSELDEYAVEQALQLAEVDSSVTITYLTMGPQEAIDAVRKALSMGGDEGAHVVDAALAQSDYLATSRVLAAAIQRLGFDLVLCGMSSTDGDGSVLPAMLAERLGVAQLTLAGELTVADHTVSIRRTADVAIEEVTARLPAVVSVTDHVAEPRYPSFKGTLAAKKRPVVSWSIDDLGIAADQVGRTAAKTRVTDVEKLPRRQAGSIVKDDGEGGTRLAEFLISQGLA